MGVLKCDMTHGKSTVRPVPVPLWQLQAIFVIARSIIRRRVKAIAASVSEGEFDVEGSTARQTHVGEDLVTEEAGDGVR